ncbi:phage head-tail connector protein [Sporolactobacillus terrae]|uniref:phage head-tail connector protein n=1 Tax=Sporolactobacillus terrae TaxID=269673 RepID=UPI0009DDA64E|nr:phage head-tail connector protein [Sporolactobacillus terrae]
MTVPQALLQQIKTLTGLNDDTKDAYLNTVIPLIVEDAQEQCNNTFDINNLPAGIIRYLAKVIEFDMGDSRLKSRSLGNVSYSFNTELPDSVTRLLRPYKRVRFRCL